MDKFETEQKVFNITGVTIGGQPGEYPTVLISTFFHAGDKKVLDEKVGKFDKERTKKVISEIQKLSEWSGNPTIIDLVIPEPGAIVPYIDFIAEVTDYPFLLDGTTAPIRIKTLDYVKEIGLQERTIFNSITPETKQEEVDAIKAAGLKNGLLLTYGKMPTVKGRLDLVDGLIETAKKAGLEKLLIDAMVLDIPDIGTSAKAVYEIKKKYGYPTGCGPANSLDMWKSIKKRAREEGKEIFAAVDAIGNALPIFAGGDFVLYGPGEYAKWIYPAIAFVDALLAYGLRDFGVRVKAEKHPLRRIFR